MTRKLLVGAIAAGALAVSAGTAFALTADDGGTPGTTSVATSLTDPASSTSSSSDDTFTSVPTVTSEGPTSDTPTLSTPAPGGVQLSAEDASRIVLERFGGTVHEVEREYEHGRLEWKVEITASTGVTYDVRIDAATGTVTRVEQDSRGGDDDRDDDRGGDDHGRHGGDDH